MKQVAVITVLAVCAAMTATVVIYNSRDGEQELATSREALRAQNDALRQRVESLEQSLAAASKRDVRAVGAGPAQPLAAAAAAPTDSPVPEAAPPAPTPEQIQRHETSLQAGTALVEGALRTGQWTLNDITALGAEMHYLTDAERAELMTRLTVAINNQQVKVDMRRPGQ